jgi:hypothetical protein
MGAASATTTCSGTFGGVPEGGSAVAHAGFGALGASVLVTAGNPQTNEFPAVAGVSQAEFTDSFTIGNAPDSGFLNFVFTVNGTTETVCNPAGAMGDGGYCINNSGTSVSLSTNTGFDQPLPTGGMSLVQPRVPYSSLTASNVVFALITGADCTADSEESCSSGITFLNNVGVGVQVIGLSVLDFDGNPVAGATVTSASGTNYNATTPPVLTSGKACDGLFTGTFTGNITVSVGQNCMFVNGTITENVKEVGGNLELNGVVVNGWVHVNGGVTFSIGPLTTITGDLDIRNVPVGTAQNQVCGSTVSGDLDFKINGSPVEIGSASVSSCGGNVIGGDLDVENNAAANSIYGNTVKDNLLDRNNTAASVVDGNTVGDNLKVDNNAVSTQVFNNSVTNDLQCQNDTSITGGGNTAQQKKGQCSSF